MKPVRRRNEDNYISIHSLRTLKFTYSWCTYVIPALRRLR
jgi:hypothetical protein